MILIIFLIFWSMGIYLGDELSMEDRQNWSKLHWAQKVALIWVWTNGAGIYMITIFAEMLSKYMG